MLNLSTSRSAPVQVVGQKSQRSYTWAEPKSYASREGKKMDLQGIEPMQILDGGQVSVMAKLLTLDHSHAKGVLYH